MSCYRVAEFCIEVNLEIISSSTSHIGVPQTISSYDINSILKKVFGMQINLGNPMLKLITCVYYRASWSLYYVNIHWESHERPFIL